MNRTFCVGLGLAITAFVGPRGLRRGPQAASITPRCGPVYNLQPQRTLHAHSDEVRALTYSRDGRLLVSAGEDGKVKLWTARGSRCVRTLHVSTPCVALSPNGRWLATANFDPNLPPDTYDHPSGWAVKIWAVRSGRLVRALSGHKGPVLGVAWSPNGALLASASGDGSVRLWQTHTWRTVATLREPFADTGSRDWVGAAQALFSPNGKALAVVTTDVGPGMPGDETTHVSLWDVATRKRQRLLLDEYRCVSAIVAFTPDSRELVAATQGFPSYGNVYAWDLPRGSTRTLTEEEDASYAAAMIPPGRWFAAGGKGWTAFLLYLRTGEIVAGLPHPAEVMAMAASPDGRTLATGDARGTIRFWAVPPPAPLPVRRSNVRGAARAGR